MSFHFRYIEKEVLATILLIGIDYAGKKRENKILENLFHVTNEDGESLLFSDFLATKSFNKEEQVFPTVKLSFQCNNSLRDNIKSTNFIFRFLSALISNQRDFLILNNVLAALNKTRNTTNKLFEEVMKQELLKYDLCYVIFRIAHLSLC